MEIKIETQGNEMLLKIKGRIDTATAVEFEKAIAPFFRLTCKWLLLTVKSLIILAVLD